MNLFTESVSCIALYLEDIYIGITKEEVWYNLEALVLGNEDSGHTHTLMRREQWLA